MSLGLTALLVTLAYWGGPAPSDDAYIHLRIAEHLATHGQPYFNLGDPVMGSSSPAWTVVLAFLHRLPGTWPVKLGVFESILVLGTVYQGLRVVNEQTRIPRGVSALIGLGLVSILYRSALGWMETPLAVFLWLSALRCLLRRQAIWGLFLGLAVAVRPELVVVGTMMALYALSRQKFQALPAWGLILTGGLPFVLYDLLFFGTVIPAPVYAKRVVYDLTMSESAMTASPIHRGHWALAWLACVTVSGAATLVLSRRRNGDALGEVITGGGTGLFLLYVVKQALVFRWYHPLFVVPWAMGVLLTARKGRVEFAVFAFALTALPYVREFTEDLSAMAHGDAGGGHGFAANARVRKYLDVGERLRVENEDGVLLTSEIGGLGFAFGGTVMDAVGLVSPDAVSHHPMVVGVERASGGLGAIPTSYVEEVLPDFVVTLDVFGHHFLASSVADSYSCELESPYLEVDQPLASGKPLYGATSLVICRRHSMALR